MNTVNNFFALGELPKDVTFDFELMRAMIGDDKPRRVFPVIEQKEVNEMNCIITILGVSQEDYLSIRDDLQAQLKALDIDPLPLFARLPADYVSIEVIWLEEPQAKVTSAVNKLGDELTRVP